MAWELSVIKARHRLMLDLHLQGLTNVQIAEEMDCTDVSVGMVLRSPIVQEELARRRESITSKVDGDYVASISEARRILAEATPDAARTFKDQLAHNDPRVAANAARNILEQTFGDGPKTPASVVQINVESMTVLQEALKELQTEAA